MSVAKSFGMKKDSMYTRGSSNISYYLFSKDQTQVKKESSFEATWSIYGGFLQRISNIA